MRNVLRLGLLVGLLASPCPALLAGSTGGSGSDVPTLDRRDPAEAPAVAPASQGGRFRAGAPGVGDPYFPEAGNGGYDVQHYDLDVRYDPLHHRLWGVATIRAVATENLDRFNLDLVGLIVRNIEVDRKRARWSRTDHELTVRPQHKLRAGKEFTATVRYDGSPTTFVIGPLGESMGFMRTDDGAIVAGEPESAAGWFPVNDHPTDRATYRFRVTVPRGYQVVANGLPRGRCSSRGWTTFVWEARDPMASYLATIDIGDWSIREYRTYSGLPVIDAVDPDVGVMADAALARQPEIVEVLEDAFGPYPFETVGAIIDDHPQLTFALETQTRPVYPRYAFAQGTNFGTEILAHELAHQWFGDSVAVGRWKDIWLNEGFATYGELLWLEHEGVAPVGDILSYVYDSIPPDDSFWSVVVGDPGIANLFSPPTYVRGAMTLQALRDAVGEQVFWEILRAWASDRALGTGTTPEFIALAEELSGEQLDELFDTWLFTAEKPPLPPLERRTALPLSSESARRVGSWREHVGSMHKR